MAPLLSGLLDWLFPRSCAVCHGEVSDTPPRHLCWECARRIRYQSVERFCTRCGRDIPGTAPGPFVCAACTAHPPAFEAGRSAAHYDGPVRTLVHALKYGKDTSVVPDLADLMEACHSRHYAGEPIDAVCPVPLHPRRLRKRGFNQSELLAENLARRLGVPVLRGAIRRVRDTRTQTHLGAAERRANVLHAFAPDDILGEWAAGRTLLLVDDVMTTGATLSSAAAALHAAGADRVLALTVARD